MRGRRRAWRIIIMKMRRCYAKSISCFVPGARSVRVSGVLEKCISRFFFDLVGLLCRAPFRQPPKTQRGPGPNRRTKSTHARTHSACPFWPQTCKNTYAAVGEMRHAAVTAAAAAAAHGICAPNRSHTFLAKLAFITAAGETVRAAHYHDMHIVQCVHSKSTIQINNIKTYFSSTVAWETSQFGQVFHIISCRI